MLIRTDNIEVSLVDKYLVYNDINYLNRERYFDVCELFDLIDENVYTLVEHINLVEVDITGDLWTELYRFKNLKSVKYGDHDDSSDNSFKMNKLEFKYNNNIEIYDESFELSFELIFEFYKKHQDDEFYNNDLFKAGLNEVNLFKNNNNQVSEMLKILSDDLHKDNNGFYIFKDKFGNYGRFL